MISYNIITEGNWFYGEEVQNKYYAIRSNPDLSFVRIWGSLFDSDDFVLKARANNIYYCSCPFHNAKDHPVCIDENQKGFYCYGCGRGGTIISVIAEHFDIDRDEAVNILYAYMTNNASSLSQEELAILNKIINGYNFEKNDRYFAESISKTAYLNNRIERYVKQHGYTDDSIKKMAKRLCCTPKYIKKEIHK